MVSILDDFIHCATENKAALTAKRYTQFCQGFVKVGFSVHDPQSVRTRWAG